MEIKVSSYRQMTKELRRIADLVTALQPYVEEYFRVMGITPPDPKLSKQDREAEVDYVNEEEYLLRELKRELGEEDDEDGLI